MCNILPPPLTAWREGPVRERTKLRTRGQLGAPNSRHLLCCEFSWGSWYLLTPDPLLEEAPRKGSHSTLGLSPDITIHVIMIMLSKLLFYY